MCVAAATAVAGTNRDTGKRNCLAVSALSRPVSLYVILISMTVSLRLSVSVSGSGSGSVFLSFYVSLAFSV